MQCYLGIEIGGTKLQLGLGAGDGTWLAFRRFAVDVTAGGAGIRRAILQEVPKLLGECGLGKADVKALGIGFGGPVNDGSRRTITSHQVCGWDDFPLAEWAEEHFQVPTVVGNDADVAGLAEATLGAGKGLSPVFYMNIGSGIGGALILDGRIHRGVGLGAGEVGHLWIDYDLDTDNLSPRHPPWSILEHRASGWAIGKAGARADAEAVVQAARRGDAAAVRVLRQARRRVALALTHVIALVCPRRIVLGGGVSLIGEDLFFAPLREEVATLVFRPFAQCYDIVPAALGEEVVVHGAVALAQSRARN